MTLGAGDGFAAFAGLYFGNVALMQNINMRDCKNPVACFDLESSPQF
jgi:hypothetical protein